MMFRVRFQPSLPNFITILRFFSIPVMVWVILRGEDSQLAAFILFGAIWATDLLDGYLARRMHQVTDFGKLFDPFVDKVFQLATAIAMYLIGKLPVWVAIVIGVKELLMVVGSCFLLRRMKVVVYARWYGKLATFLLALAFAALFWIPTENRNLINMVFLIPILATLHAYIRYGLDFHREVRRSRAATDAAAPNGTDLDG